MTYIIVGLLLATITGLIVSIWALICNEITYNQRKRLTDKIFSSDDWERLDLLFSEVTYGHHHKALMKFTDPYKLYAKDLKDLL